MAKDFLDSLLEVTSTYFQLEALRLQTSELKTPINCNYYRVQAPLTFLSTTKPSKCMHAGPGILANTTHASGRSEVDVHAFLLEKAKYAPLKHFALCDIGSLFRMLSQRAASTCCFLGHRHHWLRLPVVPWPLQ